MKNYLAGACTVIVKSLGRLRDVLDIVLRSLLILQYLSKVLIRSAVIHSTLISEMILKRSAIVMHSYSMLFDFDYFYFDKIKIK